MKTAIYDFLALGGIALLIAAGYLTAPALGYAIAGLACLGVGLGARRAEIVLKIRRRGP